MSLVQAVICNDFALVCGEQRLNLSGGGVLHNFRKVFRVNENVVLGLAGSMDDNYYLFQDYLTIDFELKEDFTDSLAEVFRRVTARYDEMMAQGECDVFSLVCGWDGYSFAAKTFFIDSGDPDSAGITDVRPAHEKDAKVISCGDHRHYDNLLAGIERHGFGIHGIQMAFLDVLSQGVMFDDFIDKNAQFELIRRPE